MIHTKEELEQFVTKNWDEIQHYLDKLSAPLPMPLYTSVDIRESHNRFAPVDNNLYPAGFNNICQLDLAVCAERLEKYVLGKVPMAKNILIIPESHTKNKFYLDHLHTLTECFNKKGFHTLVGSPDKALFTEGESLTLESHSQFRVTIYPIEIHDHHIFVKQKKIDAVILNHDQSSPLDLDWKALKTPVFPTPHLGWTVREKNAHFAYYAQVVAEFCERFNVNPLLISARFATVDHVDFESKEGLEVIAQKAQALFDQMDPGGKIFLKASQGTYGMGITVIESAQEILEMNRKTRNKMDVGKNNIKFSSVLIQEGIETMVTVDGHPAEITIYLVGGKSTGGFMRSNPLKDSVSNLNSKGMVYKKYCISEIGAGCDHLCKEAVYCLVARLSTIATALEIQNITT